MDTTHACHTNIPLTPTIQTYHRQLPPTHITRTYHPHLSPHTYHTHLTPTHTTHPTVRPPCRNAGDTQCGNLDVGLYLFLRPVTRLVFASRVSRIPTVPIIPTETRPLRARHHVDYPSGTVGDSVPVLARHGRRGAAQRHAQQQQNKEETRGKKEEEHE